MRRKDREMGKDFALEIIDSSLFGTAAIKDESSKKKGVYRGIITFKRWRYSLRTRNYKRKQGQAF